MLKSKSMMALVIATILLVSSSAGLVSGLSGPTYSTVSKKWILNNLNNPDVVLLDARSLGEYLGKDIRALRGGHIPGAVNIESSYSYYNVTLKSDEELTRMFKTAGVTKDKLIVCYCQSGTRSKDTYGVLQTLGFPRIAIYLESWADWGNDPSTPVETICRMALVNGPKDNSGGCGCGSNSPYDFPSPFYIYESELTGAKRLMALAEDLTNRNFTRLMSNFLTGKYIPQMSKFQAVELIQDENNGSFSESSISTLPFRPITPYDSFVDAEILYANSAHTTLTGAILEENVTGKSWSTFYWVNQTGQITTAKFDPCDYWCIVTCAFTHPQIWAECTVFCYCAFVFPPCIAPCAICIIALGAVAAICTIPCCPSTVTLRVESTPVHDGYLRYHGLTVNEVLRSDFETTQKDKIFITTSSYFSYSRSISVHAGDNYVMEAPGSQWPNWYWNTKIYINGVLMGQGDVGYNHILTVHFNV